MPDSFSRKFLTLISWACSIITLYIPYTCASAESKLYCINFPKSHALTPDASMYTIQKSFDFCYAHRVWNQEVPPCKCRNIHGHEGTITVTLEQSTLHNGMVLDFTALKPWIASIKQLLDHHLILDISDPLTIHWMEQYNLRILHPFDVWSLVFRHRPPAETLTVDSPLTEEATLSEAIDTALSEAMNFVVVDGVPTSENLARWAFDSLTQYIHKNHPEFQGRVVSVEWSETKNSRCSYSPIIRQTNTESLHHSV